MDGKSYQGIFRTDFYLIELDTPTVRTREVYQWYN